MYADLHLHTHYSDGTYTPEELAERGREQGLGVLALTDHDTIDGCRQMALACAERDIEFVSGCEFTVELDGFEIHLLGYFLNLDCSRLIEELEKYQNVRQNRIHEIVSRLNKLGIEITSNDVLDVANCNSPGRPHIGRVLVAKGHCRSLDESFQKYLKKGRPAWVPKDMMTASEAIELIHEAGGLAVMAHPGLYHRDDIISPLVESGLDGIECFYTRHSTAMTEHYLLLAEQYGLIVTGGSDCHGENKGRPLIGGVKLPYSYIERMKSAVSVRDGYSG